MSFLRHLSGYAALLLASTTLVLAQGDACKTTEVPVGVINPNGESYVGLSASSFSGHAGKLAIPVKAMTYDDAPRRIVLVVDQGKKVTADAHKAEQDMLASMLGAARAQDSFALVTARGTGSVVKFGDARAALSEAMSNEGMGSKGKDIGVMDAILQAIDMFGEAKPGDSIIVMAYDMEGNHGANARKVAKALEDHHVRLFGLALGLVGMKNMAISGQTTTAWGLSTATSAVGDVIYETGDDNFYPLTRNSGGMVLSVMNYDPKKNFSMKDPALQARVKQQARMVFNMVATYYRMQIEAPGQGHGEEWSLDVEDSLRKSVPHIFLLYPHQLAVCQAQVAGK